MKITDRFKFAWNAFNRKPEDTFQWSSVAGSTGNPSRGFRSGYVSSNSIVQTAFNRIALDASMVDIMHVKVDKENGNQVTIDDELSKRFNMEANIDQTGRTFVHDLVYSLLEDGVIAIVPIDTTRDPLKGVYDIMSMRVAKVVQWYPRFVKVSVYNDRTGMREEVMVPKSDVAIIENPLYSIVNDDNSTLQRLARKLSMVDYNDNIVKSNKLNMIMQLPYEIRGDALTKKAEDRLNSLQDQLENSKYGIAYVGATDKITQLNKPLATDAMDDVKYLTEQFYNALGLTQNIFNGTANETETRAYYNRTIDPIISYILDEVNRTFLTKTARSQGHKMVAYRDPFKLVPVEQLATIADTFSRNAILSSNEIRGIVGYGPSNDPEADKLTNKNIADVNQNSAAPSTSMAAPE